ncbi:unannotated protein [freshwater metagenome]|uniref:Unannotated protein n=1 Tax=freshwater metagenome TaxID=449393 RepID=A0A6J6TP67_9ZZZZ
MGADDSCLRFGGAVERGGNDDGALALAKVVAGWLSGLLGVAEDAENVVAHLEGLAEREAVGGECGVNLGGCPCQCRTDMQRPLDRVLRRLVLDDAQCALDRSATACLLEEVEVLARHELRAHLVVDALGPLQGIGGHA